MSAPHRSALRAADGFVGMRLDRRLGAGGPEDGQLHALERLAAVKRALGKATWGS